MSKPTRYTYAVRFTKANGEYEFDTHRTLDYADILQRLDELRHKHPKRDWHIVRRSMTWRTF